MPAATGAPGAAGAAAGGSDASAEEENAVLDQIRRHEGALRSYGSGAEMAKERQRIETLLQSLRAKLHELWPVERRIKRAQRREEEARGRRDKLRNEAAAAQQAAADAQKAQDEAELRSKEAETQHETALRELEGLRPEAAKKALPDQAPPSWLAAVEAGLDERTEKDRGLLALLRARAAEEEAVPPAAKKARGDESANPEGHSATTAQGAGGASGEDRAAAVAATASTPAGADSLSTAGEHAAGVDELMAEPVQEIPEDAFREACEVAGIAASPEQCQQLKAECESRRRALTAQMVARALPY